MATALFDTILAPITVTSNTEIVATLGARTLILVTGAASFSFFGIAAVGGNVDGAVAVVLNISNAVGVNFSFLNESSSASSPVNRFVNQGGSNVTTGLGVLGTGSGIGSTAYRYYGGSIQRWVAMSLT